MSSERKGSPTPGVPPTAVVGIGASAGGLEALREFFSQLPSDTGMAFVVVQHSEPRHSSLLPEILSRTTSLPIEMAKDRTEILANRIYAARADEDLIVEGGLLRMVPRGLTRRIHMPIDTFFCSLSEAMEQKAIGVILSGSGTDGTLGLQDIKAKGGVTFAQEESSAEHSAMPKHAIESGCVDFVLPPAEIAKELSRLSSSESTFGASTVNSEAEALQQILRLLKESSGVDFSEYKQSTVLRRVHKRRLSLKLETLRDYWEMLKHRRDESDALYRDILINVTSFFRDPEMFDALQTTVFPRVVEGKTVDDPIRIWVPGCATGEEVYSLAFSLAEYGSKRGLSFSLQLFGTDVSETALEKARAAIYPASIASTLSPQRLKEFFDPVENGYQVKKGIRELCVFARQNVIADPPLSRMDLISCRNLLIYFGPALQERMIPIFHYALKPERGLLVLGKSELIDIFSDYFTPIDKTHRFYLKKGTSIRVPFHPIPGYRIPVKADPTKTSPPTHSAHDAEVEVQREIDRFILSNYSPSAVVVTGNMDIIQFRGHTSAYLDPTGRPSFYLYKILHPDLIQPVRGALDKAKAPDSRAVKCSRLKFKAGDSFQYVDIRVVPIRSPSLKETYFLVVFEESKPLEAELTAARPLAKKADEHELVAFNETDEIRRLLEELDSTRQHLQSVIDERDLGFEELQSANEEVTSSNEELQTINSELETAKEELESSNEELTTLNEQLRHSMEELRKSEEHLRALFSGVKDYAIFMLDPKGYILTWNVGAERVIGYDKKEILGDHVSILYEDEARRKGKAEEELRVAATAGRFEEECTLVRRDGSTFFANVIITPIRDESGHIYAYAKVTRDITEKKLAENKLRESELRFRRLVSVVKDYAIFMLDPKGYVLSWNEGAERIKGYRAEEIVGQHFSKFYPKEVVSSGKLELELELATKNGSFQEEGWRLRKDGTPFWASVVLTVIKDDGGQVVGFTKVTRDLSERKEAEEKLKEREKEIQSLAKFPGERPAPVLRISLDGKLLYSNPASRVLLDTWRSDKYVSSEVVRTAQDAYHSGKPREFEVMCNQGNIFSVSVIPILTEGYINLYGTDVTELKRAEQSLKEARDELEVKVRDRTRELEESNQRLMASNAELERFAFVASHDLQEPLRMITTYLQYIEKRLKAKIDSEEMQFIDFVVEGASRMKALVEDLLAYARLGRGEEKVEAVDFNEIVKQAVGNLQVLVSERRASIEAGKLPVLNAAAAQMLQLFQNLISNAIKFHGDKPPRIVIDCEARGEEWIFSVSDNGIGINPDYAERIFVVFQRLHSDRSKYPGTGIGLAICKRIIERHRGRIWMESTPGIGSTFYFSLPKPLST